MKKPIRFSLGLLFVALPLCARADSPGVEARLQALETQVQTLAAENAALRQQLGLAAPGAGAASAPPASVTIAGSEAKLAIGGYLQLQGEAGGAPDARFPAADRFLVRRARLTVSGAFAEHMRFVFQSDFGANTLGASAAYRAQLTDLYVAWDKYEAAVVTLGQFKTPFGYEQLLPDTKVIGIERSLASDQLTVGRQIGLGVSGAFLDKRITYSTGLFNGNGVNTATNDNAQFLYAGRVAAALAAPAGWRWSAGIDGYTSRDTGAAFTGRRTAAGLDTQLVAGRAELDAEWLRTRFDRDVGADYTADGWTALGSYFLVPKQWQAVLGYSQYDPNTLAANVLSREWTVGANYLLKGDDLKFSLNGIFGQQPALPGWQKRLVGRVQVVF